MPDHGRRRDGDCVGYSYLLGSTGAEEVIVGMTGVLPQYRRRGIATALKIEGIRYAAAAGFKTMSTSTAGSNTASIAVNERLGFRRTYTEIRLEKVVGPPRPSKNKGDNQVPEVAGQ